MGCNCCGVGRLLLVLVTVSFLVACGGGDSSSVGSSPQIKEVSLWSVDENNESWEQCSNFVTGDYANVRIYYADADQDIVQIEAALYNPANATTPYLTETITIDGVIEYQDGAYIYLLEPLIVTSPVGKCRVDFFAVDSQGNESNVVSKNYSVSYQAIHTDQTNG